VVKQKGTLGNGRSGHRRRLLPDLLPPAAAAPPQRPPAEGVGRIAVGTAPADGALELLLVLLRQGGAAAGSGLAHLAEGADRRGHLPALAADHRRRVPALHARDPQTYASPHAGRRLIRKVNEDQYVNLVRSYEADVKDLLEAGRLEVLEEYGLGLEDLDKMEEAYEMFEDVQALRKRAAEELRGKAFAVAALRRIPRGKLRRIVEEELFFISNRMFEKLKLRLQEEDSGVTQEETYKIITTLCDDILFEKFGYEREEIENQLAEVPLLAKDLQKQRQVLFAHLVEFNIDSLEDEDAEVHSEPHGTSIARTVDSEDPHNLTAL
jgi:hypothetical protein